MDYNPDYNSMSEKINDSFGWIDEVVEMQFTGIKDKNGKDIYEGDILQFVISKGKNWIGAVEYCKAGYDSILAFFPMRAGETYNQYYGSWYKGNNANCIIIGNIYQNPELLK